jgi:hypothetical protein
VAAANAPGVEADPPLPASVGGAGAGAGAVPGVPGLDAPFPTQEAALPSARVRLMSLNPILERMGQFAL